MSNMVDVVRDDILQQLAEDRLTLPTLPEVALRVREVAEDPNANINQLTQIISQDTALAARILRICNSPLFRASSEIRDLHHAISRLGMDYTANLAIGLAMEQMFQATSDIIEERMRRNWLITTQVALYAAVLSERSDISADEATLAALLHRIGVLPVLSYVEEAEDLQLDGIQLDKLVGHLHARMGSAILKNWAFPESMVKVPLEYRHLKLKHDKVTHADLVTAANLLVFADKQNHFGRTNWAQVPVIDQLNLPADRQHPVIRTLHEQVTAQAGLF